MKFKYYLSDKALYILLNIILMLLFYILISPMNFKKILILGIYALWLLILMVFMAVGYLHDKYKAENIINLVDNLHEKYYIADILKKPTKLSDYGYYYALKKACKSMNDRVSEIELQNKQFTDYINMLIHEIKTPVSAISLICKNNTINNSFNDRMNSNGDLYAFDINTNNSIQYIQQKDSSIDNQTYINTNKSIENQLSIIENYLEQVLYYTRMEHTENDYFITDLNLSDVIHSSIMNFKDILLNHGVNLNVGELNFNIKSDEKWLTFIINQIIQNSIKYFDKDKKELSFFASKADNKVILSIMDNGCGIDDADMPRIFDYGFTGSNRQKKYSTGMGLYICKKLCEKLEMTITAESQKGKYTVIKLII